MKVNMPRLGKNPASKFLTIGTKKEKNDTATYAVYTVSIGEDVPVELQKEARDWYVSLNAKPAKVNDEDENKAY